MKVVYSSIRIVVGSTVMACLLVIVGCGGGSNGSSSGGGSVSLSSGTTMVKGNVSGLNTAQATDGQSGDTFLIAGVIANIILPQAWAEERVIEGIRVCIRDRCAVTDAAGSFSLDLTGVPGGEYDITFTYGGKTYRTKIEVVEDAIVILDGVSISSDGVVRVNNIRIEIIEDEPGGGNVAICHNPGPDQETIEVPESEVSAHKEHGDYLGECESLGGNVLICHFPGPDQDTIEVPESAVPDHKAHGDYLGECEPFEEEKFAICHFPGPEQETILVTEEQIGSHKEHGDYLGECEPI